MSWTYLTKYQSFKHRKAQGKEEFEGAFTEPNISLQKLIYLYFFPSEGTGKREKGKRLARAQVRNGVEIQLF